MKKILLLITTLIIIVTSIFIFKDNISYIFSSEEIKVSKNYINLINELKFDELEEIRSKEVVKDITRLISDYCYFISSNVEKNYIDSIIKEELKIDMRLKKDSVYFNKKLINLCIEQEVITKNKIFPNPKLIRQEIDKDNNMKIMVYQLIKGDNEFKTEIKIFLEKINDNWVVR